MELRAGIVNPRTITSIKEFEDSFERQKNTYYHDHSTLARETLYSSASRPNLSQADEND